MPYSRALTWGMSFVLVLGVVLTVVFHGSPLGLISDAFPSEMVQREALRHCGEMNPKFSRFVLEDRQTCYRIMVASKGLP